MLWRWFERMNLSTRGKHMKSKLILALSALALSASLFVTQSGNAQTQASCASVDGTTSTNWTDGDTVKRCTNTSSVRGANMQSTLKAIDNLQIPTASGPVDADVVARIRGQALRFYLFHEGDDYLSGALGGPTFIDPSGLVRNQVGDSIIFGSEKYSIVLEKLYLRNKQNEQIKHTTAHELGHHVDAIYAGFSNDSAGILGGTLTPGDKLKITINDPRLASPVEIKYTVKNDDTFDSVVKKLANRINADSDLSGIGIKAVDLPGLGGLRIGSSGGSTGYSFDPGPGGTETMTFGSDQRTIYSDSALFQAALEADIKGMNRSNACSIMISDPDKPGEPPIQQDGLFSSLKDENGNWICGSPGPSGTTPIYSGSNLQIAVQSWPALYPKDPDTGRRKSEELFAEEFSVIAGFSDTIADDGSAKDGSNNAFSGSPFFCTYWVVKNLAETGAYPSDMANYGYVEHVGTTNQATFHACDGSSFDYEINIGS